MLDQPPARFHQPLLQARQRPALDPPRQSQSPPQVAQVVGEHAEQFFFEPSKRKVGSADTRTASLRSS